MYTLCPHCSTCFRITTEQINAAQGNVRCGNCGAVFNALDNPAPEPDSFADADSLFDDIFPESDDPLADSVFDTPAPAEPRSFDGSSFSETEPFFSTELYKTVDDEQRPRPGKENKEIDVQYRKQKPEPSAELDFIPLGESETNRGRSYFDDSDQVTRTEEKNTPLADTIDISSQQTEIFSEEPDECFAPETENTTIDELEKLFLPDETDKTESAPPPPETRKTARATPKPAIEKTSPLPLLFNQITLSAGSLILIMLLLGQYIYFARNHLAEQYASLRPLLESMCDHLECELVLQRDLSKLQLTHRDVRSHPAAPDALLINAAFVNKATFPQPYPAIELKLSNLSGRLVGSRIFQPGEYLAGSPDIKAGIPPNTQVYLVLELADPGKQAVNFEFDFR